MTSSNVTSQNMPQHATWRLLAELTLSGKAGDERLAAELVTQAIQSLNWSKAQLARLNRAVSKAVLKAIESGTMDGSDTWLLLRVLLLKEAWAKQMADAASRELIPRPPPHGWGFFLVQKQGNTPQASGGELHNVIELFLYQENHPSFRQ